MTTKEKILDVAQDLIQTRSFHGFSYQDMADRVGIRKPSLYHHFDSKDAIALAVLERAADWVRTQLAKVDGEDPAARLERYFEMFRDIHGKGERMCPGGSFASVFDGVSSSVQSALHRFTKLHLDLLESIVRVLLPGGRVIIDARRGAPGAGQHCGSFVDRLDYPPPTCSTSKSQRVRPVRLICASISLFIHNIDVCCCLWLIRCAPESSAHLICRRLVARSVAIPWSWAAFIHSSSAARRRDKSSE